MFSRHIHRMITNLFVVLALLFSQLALANYVCPRPDNAADMSAMDMTPGQPCETMAVETANGPEPAGSVPPALRQGAAIVRPRQRAQREFADGYAGRSWSRCFWIAAAGETRLFSPRIGPARPPPDPLFLSTLRLRV